MFGLFLLAIKFNDGKGLLPFSAVALPSLLFIFLIYDTARMSIIDWDEFETPEQKQLVYEAAFGSTRTLDNLIINVGSVNFMGEAGLTPLLAAYKGRNKETFTYLLEKGANVNFMPKGSLQYNVADYIITDFDHDESSQAYFETLIDYGLDIYIGTKLLNLLQSAATNKSRWYLKYLLENGADTNRKGSLSLTPIGIATLHSYWDNALYLIPFSNKESLEEAAAIFYEHNEQGLYWYEDTNRTAFEKALVDKGIDLKKAFEIKDIERQKRLDKIYKMDNY